MKFVIDMNLSPRWVVLLQAHAIEAIHWSQVSEPTAPDTEIMYFAATHGYIVLTQDLDFGIALAESGRPRPSVVQLRTANVDPLTIGPFVIQALRHASLDLESGALLTIDPKRVRVRLLPL